MFLGNEEANSANSAFIQMDLEFNGSGSDTLRMNVYGPNSSTNQLADITTGTGSIETRYKTVYTMTNAVAGAQYFVRVTKQTADGTKSYTLTATGSQAILSPRTKLAVKAGETYPITVTSGTGWSVGGVPAWASGTGQRHRKWDGERHRAAQPGGERAARGGPDGRWCHAPADQGRKPHPRSRAQ